MNRKEIEARCTGREQRSINAELRATGDEFALMGYAARYAPVQSHNLGGFRETLAKGAFARSIKQGDDVVCLFNHDSSRILGRRSASTLTVEEDDRGLKFRCQLDKNQQSHKDLYSSVQRGDITSCSFAFTVPKGGQTWVEGKDPETGEDCLFRTLTDVNLLDTSVVCYPAYPSTSVSARALKTDYSTASDAFAVMAFRKLARAMAGILKRASGNYPAPYDYREVCKQYDDAMVHAESCLARCEDVDDTFDAWEETDERCKNCNHKDLLEAHANARASIESAAMALGAARMALARAMGK